MFFFLRLTVIKVTSPPMFENENFLFSIFSVKNGKQYTRDPDAVCLHMLQSPDKYIKYEVSFSAQIFTQRKKS